MTSTESKITIFAAILAFAGALLGTFLVNYFEKSQWEREIEYSQKKSLLEKRIELIEKTTKLLNQSSYAQILSKEVEYWSNTSDLEEFIILTNIQRKKEDKEPLKSKVDNKDILEGIKDARKRLIELSSDFAAIMQLNTLFFGPQTRDAVRVIDKEKQWWDLSKKNVKQLLESMYAELNVYE